MTHPQISNEILCPYCHRCRDCSFFSFDSHKKPQLIIFSKLSVYKIITVLQVSFMIPPEIIPGRMALLITLILCLVNIFMSVTTSSPNANTISSIGSWIIFCIIFVHLGLLEYGIILFLKYCQMTKYSDEYEKTLFKRVDLISLTAALFTFIVFNVIFWYY